jgi:energy-coupling factor transport system permease protein
MRLRVPVYRQTGSALHAARAGVAACYLGAPCVIALLYDSPVVLAGTLIGIIGAGIAAGLGRELAGAARLALPLVLLVALVNPLVSREGLTVLIGGPVVPVLGRVDITLESLVFGCVAGARVLVVILAFALFSAAVDPDKVLRLFRRLSLRSALTASLATRLVPVLGRDAERLSDAYRLRAPRPADGARLARIRRGATLTRALAAGALERSIDLAAALEVRGFGTGSRHRPTPNVRPWSRHDFAFAGATLTIVAAAAAGAITGLAGFDPYPSLQVAAGPADFAVAVTFTALLTAPFMSANA